MSRVVLVSNRVTDLAAATQAGGMSVAIADIILNNDAIWFGWNGQIAEPGQAPGIIKAKASGNLCIVTTELDQVEYDEFYLGYSNSVLWPVFHNRLDLAKFEAGYFLQYQRVNQRFAAAVASLLQPDDLIWVHDYHLIPLARALRARGVSNPIGFFLHIPVPPAQAFLAIPEHVDLANDLAAYDVVGVQTKQDVGNLIDFFHQSVFGSLLHDGSMRVAERTIRIGSYPVGIDASEFSAVPIENTTGPAELRIIGVDRLDYTKGLPHKFRAFGTFLADNAQYRGHVVLSQIAPPTRESLEAYSEIRNELESLAGSINGRYSDLDWAPILYMHRAFDRQQLCNIYRGSRVGLVTPLRDGMNLVAKEYVAAQNADDPGVLVLSRFAGAAEQLQDALIVNPYNIAEMAAAIKHAIEMPLSERKRRHTSLMSVISKYSGARWSNSFLAHLAGTAAERLLVPQTRDRHVRSLIKMLEALQRSTAQSRVSSSSPIGAKGRLSAKS